MRGRRSLGESVLALILAVAPARAAGAAAPPSDDGADPGTGVLVAHVAGQEVPFPLAGMSAAIRVSGVMVRTDIEQRFRNPLDRPLDGEYAFPIPEGAAVDAMSLRIGERTFHGEIREREEARRAFESARIAGRAAAVVEQHRPNLFRTGVANIPPRADVIVHLSLLDEADWSDGAFETVLPLTITPRYSPAPLPGEPSAREAAPEDTTADAKIHAVIDAGVPLDEVTSPSHAVLAAASQGRTEVRLARGATPLDRDFVLRWRPRASAAPVLGALVEQGEHGAYAMAMLVPPAVDLPGARGFPTQTVFVVDVSGSMAGPSIEQAKAALGEALGRLRPDDTFTLIKFDSTNEAFSETPLRADPGSIAAARPSTHRDAAGSGTEIPPALLHALDISEKGDATMLRRVVLITDGAVENEEAVLSTVAEHLGGTRLHVVGIGPAPNRWLMKELARTGRGSYESIGSREQVAAKISDLLGRTERAAITDVALEWDGAAPVDVSPDPIPDLYAGRPLVVTARLADGQPAPRLRVWGRAPGGPVTLDAAFRSVPSGSGIACRWARARVASLESARVKGADPATVRADVLALATEFSLVTSYTSFVVVADDAPIGLDDRQDEGAAELPAGGTSEPLLVALGLGLTALGFACLAARRLSAVRA